MLHKTTLAMLLLLPRLRTDSGLHKGSKHQGQRGNRAGLQSAQLSDTRFQAGTQFIPGLFHSHDDAPLVSGVQTPQADSNFIYTRRKLDSLLKKGQVLFTALQRSLPGIELTGAGAAHSQTGLEKYSYNKGDDAESIEDFAKAVGNEFSVYCNQNAHDANKFKNNAIIIYGEVHYNKIIPSIRHGRGALLLESDNLAHCLEKHLRYKENVCKTIDIFESQGLDESFSLLYHYLGELVYQLDPAEKRRIDRGIEPNESLLISTRAMDDFIYSNYDRIYASKEPQAQRRLGNTKLLLDKCAQEYTKLLHSSYEERDIGMAKRAAAVISAQTDSESTTMVVGNAHAKALFNKLSDQFPTRPIVVCFAKEQLAELDRRERQEFFEGIHADFVSVHRASKTVRPEL